jgi:hypothetical protein
VAIGLASGAIECEAVAVASADGSALAEAAGWEAVGVTVGVGEADSVGDSAGTSTRFDHLSKKRSPPPGCQRSVEGSNSTVPDQ